MFEHGVLNHTTSNFRCKLPSISLLIEDPTPLTPDNHQRQVNRAPPQPPQSPSSFSVIIPTPNHNRHDLSNSPVAPTNAPKRQNFAVEIPTRPAQPRMHPTPAPSISSSTHKPQKSSPIQGRQASLSPTPARTVVEKDRVDALVNQFATLLEDIFEAEDAFNPDAEVPTEGSVAFFASESLQEEKPWLSREIHRKLDAHLRRLGKIRVGRDGLRIETGDLARITGICERCVKAAEEVDLKNLEDDEDVEREWVVKKLGRVDNAILAANVIMLLIAGRGTDQQVISHQDELSIDLLGGNTQDNR